MEDDKSYRELAEKSAKKARHTQPFHSPESEAERVTPSDEEDLPVELDTVRDLLGCREDHLPSTLQPYARIYHGLAGVHQLPLMESDGDLPTEEGIWSIVGDADTAAHKLVVYVARHHSDVVKEVA